MVSITSPVSVDNKWYVDTVVERIGIGCACTELPGYIAVITCYPHRITAVSPGHCPELPGIQKEGYTGIHYGYTCPSETVPVTVTSSAKAAVKEVRHIDADNKLL
jgi:hypothetical protein